MPETIVLPICAAPEPCLCEWCAGSGCEPFEEGLPCLACDGCGFATCEFVLPPTFTHKKPGQRAAVYAPGRKRLTITQGRKSQSYTLMEFPADADFGRAFALAKPDGTIYRLQCGKSGVSCDCGGSSYEANAKACRRAHESGETLYPTMGCCHLDSVVPLVKAGWMDLETTKGV